MNDSQLLTEVFKISHGFKVDKKYWNKDYLTGDECTFERSKPAHYIKKAIEIFKKLDFKTIVEIGSTRHGSTKKCIDYYDNLPSVYTAPACCCDGHSTVFWTLNGFETYTVDIDEGCKKHLEWSFHDIGTAIPSNLHVHIPQDGIEFLKNFTSKIDVLFLDGWDKGSSMYAEKHLEAWEAAKDKLSDINCVLIDDTDFTTEDGGKDALLTPVLIENGYIPLFNGRQSLYLKVNEDSMKISLGDIADRYSIVRLKKERSDAEVYKELFFLTKEIEKNSLTEYTDRLYTVNGQIWDLESDIRKGKEKELGLEEVGRRAILIREKNKQRIDIKNEINSRYNSGFIEKKFNHASQ